MNSEGTVLSALLELIHMSVPTCGIRETWPSMAISAAFSLFLLSFFSLRMWTHFLWLVEEPENSPAIPMRKTTEAVTQYLWKHVKLPASHTPLLFGTALLLILLYLFVYPKLVTLVVEGLVNANMMYLSVAIRETSLRSYFLEPSTRYKQLA